MFNDQLPKAPNVYAVMHVPIDGPEGDNLNESPAKPYVSQPRLKTSMEQSPKSLTFNKSTLLKMGQSLKRKIHPFVASTSNVPRSFRDGLQLLPSCLWSIASGIRKSCSGAFNPLDISCATLFQRGFPTFSLQPKWLPRHASRIRVENDDLTHCCLLQIHLSQNLDLQKLVENQNELNPHPRLKKTRKRIPKIPRKPCFSQKIELRGFCTSQGLESKA